MTVDAIEMLLCMAPHDSEVLKEQYFKECIKKKYSQGHQQFSDTLVDCDLVLQLTLLRALGGLLDRLSRL